MIPSHFTSQFISIHAPTRGATIHLTDNRRGYVFQSTLPRGERPCPGRASSVWDIYFNPRSHEGSDTPVTLTADKVTDFNPRSHEGSDTPHVVTLFISEYFNPRSHEGSDDLAEIIGAPVGISIHAPTRGATDNRRKGRSMTGFQSTLPRGERPMPFLQEWQQWVFQSTLPRGERQQFSPKSSLFSQQKLSKIFNLNNKLF